MSCKEKASSHKTNSDAFSEHAPVADRSAAPESTGLGETGYRRCDILAKRAYGCASPQDYRRSHPGYVSWFSQTPDASIPPALKKDAMAGWREATRRLGMPLHCHYSGIWDKAAAQKHPSWAVMGSEGKRHVEGGRMCVRSPYLDKLLLPQMIDLKFNLDSFYGFVKSRKNTRVHMTV